MRVNITVPDDVAAEARAAGLNVSGVATAALIAELDRRHKIAALDEYLAALEVSLGPISEAEAAEAAAWADRFGPDSTTGPVAKPRRRSA